MSKVLGKYEVFIMKFTYKLITQTEILISILGEMKIPSLFQ